LTLVAPVIYQYWWFWQFFRFSKGERFPRARSFWWLFAPLVGYLVLFRMFKDLQARLDPQTQGRFRPGMAVSMVIMGNLVAAFTIHAPEPAAILTLIVSFGFQAVMTYRVQGAINAYVQRSYPQQVPQGIGFAEVAAVVLGVTLLGLDVLGATRAVTDQSALHAASNPMPTATPSPTPTPSAAPFPTSGDGLTITSDPNDWVGQGAAFTYDRQDAHFVVTPGAVAQPGIAIQVQYSDQFWNVVFSPPSGQTLHVGTYANAVEVPPTDGSPGLSVSGVGHGCKSFGTFTINAISQDAGGQLELLDATFVQYCDSPTGPSLRGRIRYVKP
jgi:hypothetical protein